MSFLPFVSFACAMLRFFTVATLADPPATQPASKSHWHLIWADEFNGTKIDRDKWAFDQGNDLFIPDANMSVPGWGNNELQYYTDRSDNAFVKDGQLHLRAIRETGGNIPYTSARLTTKGLFAQKFGRFEFRARLPVGGGLWPAIWLLPADNAYGSWAASGEIDVLEARGQEPNQIVGTLHFGSRWPANAHDSTRFMFPANQSIGDFHVYAIEWNPGEIRFFVDDHLYATKSRWWSCSKTNDQHQGVAPKDDSEKNAFPAPFDRPFYLVMNLAVGGDFVGPPGDKTTFPAEMVIDYVRVYEPRD